MSELLTGQGLDPFGAARPAQRSHGGQTHRRARLARASYPRPRSLGTRHRGAHDGRTRQRQAWCIAAYSMMFQAKCDTGQPGRNTPGSTPKYAANRSICLRVNSRFLPKTAEIVELAIPVSMATACWVTPRCSIKNCRISDA